MAVIDLKSRLKITLVPFRFLELRPFRFLLEDIRITFIGRAFALDTNFKVAVQCKSAADKCMANIFQ